MTSEIQNSSQPTSAPNLTNHSTELGTTSFPRRSFFKRTAIATTALGTLGSLVLPACAPLAQNGHLGSGDPVATTSTTRTPTTMPTKSPSQYSLEGVTPQKYTGGTNRAVTSKNIAKLSGLSLSSLRIEPGAMRELHWHTNANALSYCLSGQGEIGLFLSGKAANIFAIQSGSISFVPIGAIYYIRNTGSEVLHMLIAFTHEDPESINLSDSLGYIPHNLLAQNFGLSTLDLPDLPQQREQFLVNVSQALPSGSSSSPYTTRLEDIPTQTFDGGIVNALTPQLIPALDGITLFYLKGMPGSLREPHWHPNANELSYYVQGHAQIEIISPDEPRENFTVQPGDVAWVPQNYLHYINSISNDPLIIIFFFSNSKPSHVDLSQVFNAFPRKLLAASFGSDSHIFDHIPNSGDVTLVAK